MNKNKTIGFFLILSIAILAYFVVGIGGNVISEMVNITNPQHSQNISGSINFSAEIVLINESHGQYITLVAVNITNLSMPAVSAATIYHHNTSPNQTLFWNDTDYDTTALPSGTYNLSVAVYNGSNASLTRVYNHSVVYNIIIDNTAPFIDTSTISPANNSNISGVQNFNITADDHTTSLTWLYFQFFNTTSTNFTAVNNSGVWNTTIDTTSIADGRYLITIFANDTIGNVNGTEVFNITIDNTVPTVSITQAMEMNISNASTNVFMFNATVNDVTAGVYQSPGCHCAGAFGQGV